MARHPLSAGRSGVAIDLALAALMAAAAAFLAYAMPDEIFSRLVADSGLPGLLAAAEPPLGMKARVAVMAAGGLLAFASVFGLLRALDRVPASGAPKAEAEAVVETPRLRRADAHPDAPPRRPLLAGRELGEPVEAEEFEAEMWQEPERFADLEPQPLPGFLIPQDEPAAAAEAEPEETAADAPEALPGFLVPQDELPTAAEEEPVAIASGEPETAEAEPEAEAEEEPLVLDRPAPDSIDALVSQLPEPAAEAQAEPIPSLMRRLEFGLSRRDKATVATSAGPDEPEPPVGEPPAGHRLRSAIDGLQKMAARGG